MMMDLHHDPYVAEQQIRAVIFCLVAFGYIDTDFDASEKAFIRDYLHQLADHRAAKALGDIPRDDVVEKWTKHYHELLDEFDRTIKGYFTESVAAGETTEGFVLSKLRLGCFELLAHFDAPSQEAILATAKELMHADGKVDPREQQFVDELVELVSTPIELDDADLEPVKEGEVIIDKARSVKPRMNNHPWFNRFEIDFAHDKETFDTQSAIDREMMERVHQTLAEARLEGEGKLAGATSFADFAGQKPFLDGHVHVMPPRADEDYELLVVGDLHGCYSCLKAALLQFDFFNKLQAYRDDPEGQPYVGVVFLGDYIDRGRFSYSGVLRTVLQLYVTHPQHVFVLRGNHEFYLELKGRVVAPVRPCEAMDAISDVADDDHFRTYMKLFDALPNSMAFGQTFFVHGGVPRSKTFADKWEGLASLNDEDIRFEMMWSDPSDVDVVPDELQEQNARFPFGRRQFHQFMNAIGCTTMIRGHERILSGFASIFDGPEGKLLTLFSAGGENNEDLPKTSNYREVTPMALSLSHAGGVTTMAPIELDYERYNDPSNNAFFRTVSPLAG